MDERIVDAAVAHGSVTARFFLADHSVVYDFAADRPDFATRYDLMPLRVDRRELP